MACFWALHLLLLLQVIELDFLFLVLNEGLWRRWKFSTLVERLKIKWLGVALIMLLHTLSWLWLCMLLTIGKHSLASNLLLLLLLLLLVKLISIKVVRCGVGFSNLSKLRVLLLLLHLKSCSRLSLLCLYSWLRATRSYTLVITAYKVLDLISTYVYILRATNLRNLG